MAMPISLVSSMLIYLFSFFKENQYSINHLGAKVRDPNTSTERDTLETICA